MARELEAVPVMVENAIGNLTQPAGELARLAISLPRSACTAAT